jgi:hypothetical protein
MPFQTRQLEEVFSCHLHMKLFLLVGETPSFPGIGRLCPQKWGRAGLERYLICSSEPTRRYRPPPSLAPAARLVANF